VQDFDDFFVSKHFVIICKNIQQAQQFLLFKVWNHRSWFSIWK